MSDPAELYDAILTGNAKKAEEVTKQALAAGVDPSELLSKYMIPAMDEVGSRFECNEYFVPELLISARAMLEGGGFQVVDLGVDVPPKKFIEAAKEQEGTIVALSALLTTTMTQMRAVIKGLEEAGIRRQTKVMIGGAPITQQYADEIGADGFSDNASSAVSLARRLVHQAA
jgi:methanogenic corrinoid protein MtbC1